MNDFIEKMQKELDRNQDSYTEQITFIMGETPYGNKKENIIDKDVVTYKGAFKALGHVAFFRKKLKPDPALVSVLSLIFGEKLTGDLFRNHTDQDTEPLIDFFIKQNIFFVNAYTGLSKTDTNLNTGLLSFINSNSSLNIKFLICARIGGSKKSQAFLNAIFAFDWYTIIHPSARGKYVQQVCASWRLFNYKGDTDYSTSDDILNEFRIV